MQKQDHGLDTGLDVHLIPHCRPALPDAPGAGAEPVYVEMGVLNTHRWVAVMVLLVVLGLQGLVLPDLLGAGAEPVYVDMGVLNTHRWVVYLAVLLSSAVQG